MTPTPKTESLDRPEVRVPRSDPRSAASVQGRGRLPRTELGLGHWPSGRDGALTSASLVFLLADRPNIFKCRVLGKDEDDFFGHLGPASQAQRRAQGVLAVASQLRLPCCCLAV